MLRTVCAWVFAATAVWALAGCSGDTSADKGAVASTNEAIEGCNAIDASACPDPGPSFSKDIQPLLDRDCNTCHAPGSTLWPLIGYENVQDWAYSILLAVEGCTMPPADGGTPPLSSQDRAVLVGWIACGANNN
jgi:cytochrome c5